jgi:hypothetical protein
MDTVLEALEDERERRGRVVPEREPDRVRLERRSDGTARDEPRGRLPLAAVFDEIDRRTFEDGGVGRV